MQVFKSALCAGTIICDRRDLWTIQKALEKSEYCPEESKKLAKQLKEYIDSQTGPIKKRDLHPESDHVKD
jgi:hypothetical protein